MTAASTNRERMVDALGYLCACSASGATVRHADAVYARVRLRRGWCTHTSRSYYIHTVILSTALGQSATATTASGLLLASE